MCCDQVRDICVFCAVILFKRGVNLTLKDPITDARQVNGVGSRAGLRLFMGGAHSPLAIGVVADFARFCGISASGCRARRITVWVVLPGNTVEVVVLIHRGGVGRP